MSAPKGELAPERTEAERHPRVPPEFTRRVWIVVGITATTALALLLLWYLAWGLLLVFAGALLAAGLHGMSETLRERTHLPAGWALGIVSLALVAVLGLAGWFLAADLAVQFNQLGTGLTKGYAQVREYVSQWSWGRALVEEPLKPGELLASTNGLLWGVSNLFASTLHAVLGCVVLFVLGLYLAAEPGLYHRGLLRLLPHRHRHRGQEVLNKVAATLRWWLVGQLLYMTFIGVGTGVGLALLGVPSPLALALLTFVLVFVPFLGAIVAALPAVLVGLTVSPQLAVSVLVLFLVVHLIEGYLVFPLVQKISVELPPALTISAQVLLGLLFGVLGVVLATPLAAAGLVLVRKLYLEDALGEPAEDEPEPVPVPAGGEIPVPLQPQQQELAP